MTDPLEKIISDALTVDQLFSQQVARWTWQLLSEVPCRFDPEAMEMVNVDSGRKATASPNQDIFLVLAPALVKQGRSSGDDFDVAEVRLKAEVNGYIPPLHTGTEGDAPASVQNQKNSLKHSVTQSLRQSVRNIVK
ncbi:hypothetical protein BDW74DRAFT_175130 [Aspergillus multicolor]|uniref:uncharacterized protein n=1 Tax=Aspergillus multicolor TaxID=41759 RepID=UPI003CCE32DB